MREPGVYRLPAGSRVTDAVERAGGATRPAGVEGINLAAVLADGQQVVVPGRAAGAARPPATTAADGPISLGTATLEELDTIEGIGPVTAQNILDFREQNGGVSSVDDLDQISGIGPATMEALRGPPPALTRPPCRAARAAGRVALRGAGGGRPAGLAAAPCVDVEIGGATSATIGLLLACGSRSSSPRPGRAAARGRGWRWSRRRRARRPDRRRRAHRGDRRRRARGARTAPSRAIRGFVTAVPRRADGTVSVRVQTADGRLLIEAPEPVGELPVGREVRASGVVREPSPWEAAYLARYGIAEVLRDARGRAHRAAPRGRWRRSPTTSAIARRPRWSAGCREREAALARGFVLGQDDRIDPETDRRVQALRPRTSARRQRAKRPPPRALALPLLAALNLSLRTRLLCVLALIALYVPVTGAGPSIQRAAVMGGAGIVAVLAGRPRSRWYALLLAAFVTLAANPRASGDVGWQLSFAAVVGILLWAEGIRELADAAVRRATRHGYVMAEGARRGRGRDGSRPPWRRLR